MEEIELPRYRCHKEVWAFQIKSIAEDERGAIITPVESGYGSFRVTEDYVDKHKPNVGGYFVLYKGGYTSYSPADAFEDGYTRI